ncbi:OLC1v1023367C1 [Oldenlandia corymbosa var. corymbosa]|uniref:OLC1v1023367C1 n=1 Tax=Oldenlandia corymbosa var. corymbosa TaxID=529605 RepID=A0AAV1C0H7_OLDCO|nr:OLC1v1023367C1 [Oldenlandia corymbosa var. corymbosa]
MGDTLLPFLVAFCLIACLIVLIGRTVNWVWLKPKKTEKLLREQGFNGNPYKMLHGDTKEMGAMIKEAYSKPIKLCDDIVPRVLPFQHHLINKYGEKTFFWVGPIAKVLITNPELIQEILTKNSVFKKPIPNPLVKFIVAGLAGYEDEKWTKHRKIVTPAFYLEKLKNMVPAMYISCNEMIKKWEILMLQTENKNSVELDVQPYLETLTSDVICRTTFGNSHSQGSKIFQLQKQQAELTGQVLKSVYVPGWRFLPTKRNRKMHQINNELRALFKEIITEKETAMKLGKAKDDNLLSMLLKSNLKETQEQGQKHGLSIDEVIENCKTFYFAGQESTSNLLSWTMFCLSVHPSWQARAREEILQAFGSKIPDYDGLNRLKIVTMILYEVLRLYSPSVMFTRIVYKETKLGDIVLPPGVQLMLPVLYVHRDPKLWGEDSKDFNPERFAQGIANATKNQLCFFPFSWGPRICVGNNFALMEAKLALTMILRHFEFQLSPSYIHAPSFVVTHKPQHGVHIILHTVSKSN